MRAVWICIILFSILLLCVGFNSYYIQRQADRLTQIAEQLTNEERRATVLQELDAFWQKHRDWIGLSVGWRELDHLGEILSNLRWAYEAQNESEFQRYRLLFSNAIEEISRNERISIGVLF